MKIFPAIDIKDKKCVRLIKGDFDNKTEYETSPIDQAQKYKDHGFKNLHIVDLDGALSGETVNLDVIEEIVSKLDGRVERGGGKRKGERRGKEDGSGEGRGKEGGRKRRGKKAGSETGERGGSKEEIRGGAKDRGIFFFEQKTAYEISL